MFTTLLESRAPRTRRRGGATVSALLHGALVAAGVTLTAHQRSTEAAPVRDPVIHFALPTPVVPQHPAPVSPAHAPQSSTPFRRIDLVVMPPTITPDHLPPITTGPEILPERIGNGGVTTPDGPIGKPINRNGIVDVEYVERAPSLRGQPRQPRYPSLLSQTGTSGQVVIRFVIDTLGRAEMGDITVVESTHALFTEAVKAVLPDYRFTPGEVGGKKVRTLVQMPFAFSVK